MERAEAVKQYLYMQHQIPLHKINVISYGEEKPVCAEQHPGGPRAESPRRRPRAFVDHAVRRVSTDEPGASQGETFGPLSGDLPSAQRRQVHARLRQFLSRLHGSQSTYVPRGSSAAPSKVATTLPPSSGWLPCRAGSCRHVRVGQRRA